MLVVGLPAYFLLQQHVRLVNQRARGESTLARERDMLRTLIDNTPDFIYVKDTDCRFVLVNLPLARTLGASTTDELLGKNDFDFFSAQQAQDACSGWSASVATSRPASGRKPMRSRRAKPPSLPIAPRASSWPT